MRWHQPILAAVVRKAADVLLTVVKAVSSANWSHWDGSATHIGKSIVQAKKRRGPRTDPCGTPAGTGSQEEVVSLTQTHWWRFVK